MTYRHYLTFRWERATATRPYEGWLETTTDSPDAILTNNELLGAAVVAREGVASRLGVHPTGRIMMFIVNHTAVTL